MLKNSAIFNSTQGRDTVKLYMTFELPFVTQGKNSLYRNLAIFVKNYFHWRNVCSLFSQVLDSVWNIKSGIVSHLMAMFYDFNANYSKTAAHLAIWVVIFCSISLKGPVTNFYAFSKAGTLLWSDISFDILNSFSLIMIFQIPHPSTAGQYVSRMQEQGRLSRGSCRDKNIWT